MSREPIVLSDIQRDRAIGALLGTAAGDALGADRTLYPPGRWTDNTAMAIAVAEIGTLANDLCALQRITELVQRWSWWARNATDVGPQTAAVFAAVAGDEVSFENVPKAAAGLYEETGRTLDGSCLNRAFPAALNNLDPGRDIRAGIAARTLCRLTHGGPDAREACALWAIAVRHAVLTGELDLRVGLPRIDADRQELWAARIAEAERSRPADFADRTDDVVAVFQAAWSAIATTPVTVDDPQSGVFVVDHLRLALEAAVGGGGHTDTVASVAGGLLGAAYGATAIPWQWRPNLRGWPGLNTHLLVSLVEKICNGGDPQDIPGFSSWRERPAPQHHPRDEGLWIGEVARLEKLPKGVEVVVSLCPIDDGNIPTGVRHLEVRLANEVGANANLNFVLLDTVRAIEQLRAEGAEVFLHGLKTHNRAPAVAALYGARRAGIDVGQALDEVCAVLPDADPTPEFRAALRRLSPTTARNNR
jgi:ADP-ribosylglycohydrolase